jgi:hypothetical protein
MSLLLLCDRQADLARCFAEKVLDNTLSVNLKLKQRGGTATKIETDVSAQSDS